jgi:hypothetical protein
VQKYEPKKEDPPVKRSDPPDDPTKRGKGGGSGSGGNNSGGNNGGGSNGGGNNSGGNNSGGNSGGGGMRDFPTRGGDRGRDRGDQGNSGSNSGQNRPGGDNMLGKKNGRSGSVQYGSNNNVKRDSRSSMNIDRIPIDIKRGSLSQQVRRSDEIRIGSTRIRFGYTHYNSRWCDDYFSYPYYVFDPYQADFACSPWYYYSNLPPYFNSNRCYFPTNFIWQPFYGVRYRWNQPSREYWNRDYNELDYVVQDIVDAFLNGDRRAVTRLIPRNGQVGIITDGKYAYSLRSDDFYDTFLDAVENTQTRDYKILDVQYRRDTASVFARHDFDDPWGRRVTVNHYFKLEAEGRSWVIREFGTSSNRW